MGRDISATKIDAVSIPMCNANTHTHPHVHLHTHTHTHIHAHTLWMEKGLVRRIYFVFCSNRRSANPLLCKEKNIDKHEKIRKRWRKAKGVEERMKETIFFSFSLSLSLSLSLSFPFTILWSINLSYVSLVHFLSLLFFIYALRLPILSSSSISSTFLVSPSLCPPFFLFLSCTSSAFPPPFFPLLLPPAHFLFLYFLFTRWFPSFLFPPTSPFHPFFFPFLSFSFLLPSLPLPSYGSVIL